MKKLLTIMMLMAALSAVSNVALANFPWPECYPCPTNHVK